MLTEAVQVGKLTACDKWHLGEPPDIVPMPYRTSRGYMAYRRRCRICDRFRRKAHGYETPERELYGVIPLNWKAPKL